MQIDSQRKTATSPRQSAFACGCAQVRNCSLVKPSEFGLRRLILNRDGGSSVGLSNILDSEFIRRKPTKRSHGEVVGAAVVDSKLHCKVIQREKAAAGVKAFLILAVAALHFAVVARRIGADELVADTQLGGGGLKQSREIPLAVGKTVGELKSIVSLDTFHADTSAGVPLEQLFQKIGGGTGGLLRVGSQEAQAGKLVNSSVLV